MWNGLKSILAIKRVFDIDKIIVYPTLVLLLSFVVSLPCTSCSLLSKKYIHAKTLSFRKAAKTSLRLNYPAAFAETENIFSRQNQLSWVV